MLTPKELDLFFPQSVSEGVEVLKENENALLLAGGTDLLPKLKRGQVEPDLLVSLSRVEELHSLHKEKRGLRIGAMVTLRRLEELEDRGGFESLYEAVKVVATPILRNSATIGGNLLQDTRCRNFDQSSFWRDALGYCLKKGGDTCKIAPGGDRCYATFCSDVAPSLVVLDAEVKIRGEEERCIPLETLYQDDGINHLKKRRHEILTEILIPKGNYLSTYRKLRIRGGIDFPDVGVALALNPKEDGVQVNVAIVGVSSGMLVRKEVFERANLENHLKTFVDSIYHSLKPMDTLYFPPLYRKRMAKVLLERSLKRLLGSQSPRNLKERTSGDR